MENDFSIIAKFVLSEDFLPSLRFLERAINNFFKELLSPSNEIQHLEGVAPIVEESRNLKAKIEDIIAETEKLNPAFTGAEAAIVPHEQLGKEGKQELETERKKFESKLAAIKKAETTEIDKTKERFEKRIAGLSDANQIKKEEKELEVMLSEIGEDSSNRALLEAKLYVRFLREFAENNEIESPSNQASAKTLAETILVSFNSLEGLNTLAVKIVGKFLALKEQIHAIISSNDHSNQPNQNNSQFDKATNESFEENPQHFMGSIGSSQKEKVSSQSSDSLCVSKSESGSKNASSNEYEFIADSQEDQAENQPEEEQPEQVSQPEEEHIEGKSNAEEEHIEGKSNAEEEHIEGKSNAEEEQPEQVSQSEEEHIEGKSNAEEEQGDSESIDDCIDLISDVHKESS